MKLHYCLFILLLLFSVSLFSQTASTVSITGMVYDASSKEPVEQASIRLLNANDSSYVNGAATNREGKFTINTNPGRYIVTISFLGYAESYVNVNAANSRNNIGNIYLRDDGILLNEATVVAKAPEIVVRGDTVEYNADSYKVQESAVLEDLVKRLPGAEIDSEGNITINGREIKKILVDGKEFFSDDPKVASKNLPAQMVDKLQVLDRRSDMSQMTGFDDGEEETVINLTIKPGMKEGLFGNAYAGVGSHDRYEANGLLNYMRNNSQFTLLGGSNNTNNAGFSDFASNSFGGMRAPRGLRFGGNNGILKSSSAGFNFATETSSNLKWGGDIRYGSTDNDVTSESYTRYFATHPDSMQYETKKSRGNNNSDNFNANFRLEWEPDSLTKIIFKPNFRYNKNHNFEQSESLTTWTDENDRINWGNSYYSNKGNGTNANGELEISRRIGKPGRVLSFRLSGGINQQNSDGNNWSVTYFANDSVSEIDQVFRQKNKGHNWRGYVSYVEPIGRNNFMQLTYSYSKNYSESDKKTYNNDGYGEYTIIDTASTRKLENDFINQEIALNFKSVRERYNYTVGFAVQPSNSESWNILPDTAILTKNDVVNFSPVAQFNYMWDRRHSLRLDYKGTVNQPSTNQLSSARDESDPMNIAYGNPDLKPSFTNRLRIRYRKFNPEQASALMVFGNFDFVNNDIVSYTVNYGNGRRETTYRNVNGNWGANLRVIYNTPLRNKKFSVNSMTYGSYDRSNGFVNEFKNSTNSFNFTESLGLEYRSDLFDAGIRGNFSYRGISNRIDNQEDYNYFNYGGNINTTFYLPYDITIESDLNYSENSGYSDGYDQNEWIWNASIAKQIFKAKNGTIRFKIYDILQDRSNITRTSNDIYIRDTRTNTLNSYWMVHFIYRFQIFKGGAKQSDMMREGRGFGPHGMAGPPRI